MPHGVAHKCIYLFIYLYTHTYTLSFALCHRHSHVVINEEFHIFVMTFFHQSYLGILPRFAAPLQSLQRAQHEQSPRSLKEP